MIKSHSEKENGPIEIDLTGPDGNAFVLIGIATNLAKRLKRLGMDIDVEKLKIEMMSGSYENLIAVMEREFGDFIIMYK